MKAKMAPPPSWMQNYFIGVPIPAAAFLVLLPLMGEFALETPLPGQRFISAFLLILVGLLMISRIPTFSLKGSHVEPRNVLPLLLIIGVLMAALINAPWVTLTTIGVLYFLTIPVSYRRHRILQRTTRPSIISKG
jgi:CDP-diacylglycerol--serine O-phosphatidyltransferase